MPQALLINASPRKEGNTSAMLKDVAGVLESSGIDSEIIRIADKPVSGCRACGTCKKKKNRQCVIKDALSDPINRAMNADALIIGSPTYFADLTAEAKAFIDRCGYVARANDFALERKIGAAVVAERRAGAIHVMDSINHMFLVNKMFVAGSSYWNMAVAKDIGDYASDPEGIETMMDLGKNIAWYLDRTIG